MSTDARSIESDSALLVIDVQNDFLPGGSLAVTDGTAIIPVLNRCIQLFASRHLPVIFSRDWHPPNHCSFVSQGGRWPPHCIANSPGAEFAASLQLPASALIISKATQAGNEAYSAFQHTTLTEQLRKLGVQHLYVGGLATDYCVHATVDDALDDGFTTTIITDAVKPVEIKHGDGKQALQMMAQRGARLLDSHSLLNEAQAAATSLPPCSSKVDHL